MSNRRSESRKSYGGGGDSVGRVEAGMHHRRSFNNSGGKSDG